MVLMQQDEVVYIKALQGDPHRGPGVRTQRQWYLDGFTKRCRQRTVVRSGVMPKCSCAQPLAMRNPVMTSSKHSNAPLSVHNCRRPCAVKRSNLKGITCIDAQGGRAGVPEPSWE